MKKIIFGALAFAALALTSCNSETKVQAEGENAIDPCLQDSISAAYGTFSGYQIASEMAQVDSLPENAKAQLLKGLQTVFAADINDRNTIIGMRVALGMLQEMEYMKQEGITIDKSAMLNAYKQALYSDSIDYMKIQNAGNDLNALVEKAMNSKKQAEAATGSQNPASVQNDMIAKEYISNLMEADKSYKQSNTGLVYKITEEGIGDKPAANSDVVFHYTGRHLDGTVFDSSEGGDPLSINNSQLVAGMREGLMLLGRGGSATIYVPGSLGYGERGAGNIGPNEMLVFDVQLLDFK